MRRDCVDDVVNAILAYIKRNDFQMFKNDLTARMVSQFQYDSKHVIMRLIEVN